MVAKEIFHRTTRLREIVPSATQADAIAELTHIRT